MVTSRSTAMSGQGYEKAFLNLPVTQGAKVAIRTAMPGQRSNSKTEALCGLLPGPSVEFPELALRDSGARASKPGTSNWDRLPEFQGRQAAGDFVSFSVRKSCDSPSFPLACWR